MKVIILAGGLGTRLAEETSNKPKPMVEIDGKPILWHIMKSYQSYIDCEFIIATGYLSEVIEEYLSSDQFVGERIKAKALFTGNHSSTGGRVKQAMAICPGERVMVTYGDGVSDVNIESLLSFHKDHKKLATVTAVRPAARFGRLEMLGDQVTSFSEKSQSEEGWINGGYFVFEPLVAEYIESNSQPLELGPLGNLSKEGNLMAFKHSGFWQPMDTLREKLDLEKLVRTGDAPWMRNFRSNI
jgi:glucose-1-phosphate cytidylyltransferase